MRDPDNPDIVVLDDTRFQPESGDLEAPGGTRTRLAPQPARLLALLVAHRGSVVSRKTIARELWPAGAVDVDAGIGFAIREIRKGLEAAGADVDLIETIPRRGYRLRGPRTPARPHTPTHPHPPTQPPTPTQPHTPTHPPTEAPAIRARSPVPAAGLLGLLGLLVISGAIAFRGLRSAPPPTIAVFPYAGAAAVDSDRPLTGELAARVTALLTERFPDRLGVIGPNGVADLRGPEDTDGAAALGVCLVLSGSARHTEETGTIVFTQIVRTSDRVHLWARWDTIAAGASLQPFLTHIESGAEAAAGSNCPR